jgi:hypothetical protein
MISTSGTFLAPGTLWGYHLASYTRETLKWHVEEHGYELVDSEPNIHLYPQFCLRFKKL